MEPRKLGFLASIFPKVFVACFLAMSAAITFSGCARYQHERNLKRDRAEVHIAVLSDLIEGLDKDGSLIRFVDLPPDGVRFLQGKFQSRFRIASTNEAVKVAVAPRHGIANALPLHEFLLKGSDARGSLLTVYVEEVLPGQRARAKGAYSDGLSFVMLQYSLEQHGGKWVIKSVEGFWAT